MQLAPHTRGDLLFAPSTYGRLVECADIKVGGDSAKIYFHSAAFIIQEAVSVSSPPLAANLHPFSIFSL
jgi:hypothetical protein